METAKRMEDLCQLLLREDAPATEWYNLLTETLHETDPLIILEFSEEQERQSVNMPLLPQLLHVIRECLLNHRWSEALQILQSIVHIPEGTSNTVWKVSTELLSMDGDENRDLIQNLYSKMRGSPDMNEKEVLMEYVAYLLHIRDDTEATTVMQEMRKRQGMRKATSVERDQYIGKLHKAYLGLLWYLEWKKCMTSYNELMAKLDGSGQYHSVSQQNLLSQKMSLTTQIQSNCDKAKCCFQELIDSPGIWDIFVTKYAELLTWENMEIEAYDVLKNYCETNTSNVNAHKYLYTYCKEHFPEHESKLSSLQVIAQMSPSDSLVLDLCTHYIDADDISSAVPLLFNLLDYSCWQEIEKPWKMMSQCLKEIYENRITKGKEVVQKCWKERESWWPSYHFTKYRANVDNVSNGGDSGNTIIRHKAAIASILCGKDNEFVEETLKNVTTADV